MTVVRSHRSHPVEDADEGAAVLREHGLRVSASRRVVLEALFAATGPVSAEKLAAGVVGRVPRSDLASVYRNLETLEQIGLVHHVHLGHGPGLYALAGPSREYAVCESCDAVVAVDSAELDLVRDAIKAAVNYEAHFSHFPIVGLCAACAAEADAHDETL